MKKILILVVILVLAAAAVIQFSGSFQQSADGLTLAEATYSVRSTDANDSTAFLVGKFLAEDGSKLVFDGNGKVTRIEVNFSETEGSYSLMQAENGAAVIRLDLGSGPALYTFRLTSPQGEFALTDRANIEHTFTPVE